MYHFLYNTIFTLCFTLYRNRFDLDIMMLWKTKDMVVIFLIVFVLHKVFCPHVEPFQTHALTLDEYVEGYYIRSINIL